MRIGFSIYEALRPYAGQVGEQQTAPEFEALCRFALDSLRASGVRQALVHLPSVLAVDELVGVWFGVGSAAPTGWRDCPLAANDALADDFFIITDDDALPLLLVARREQNSFHTLVSIDEPLIENARALLTQYHGEAYVPLPPRADALWEAGRHLGRLVQQFPVGLVASWVSRALGVTGAEQVRALQQVSGAVWIRWKDFSSGMLPNPLPPQTYQREQLMLPDGSLLEAVGYAGDFDFPNRFQVCAGLLSTQQTVSEAVVRQVNLSFSLDTLFAPEADPASELPDTSWPPEINEAAPVPAQQPGSGEPNGVVSVPGASLELLKYVNREISSLRDAILDIGLAPHLPSKPRQRLDEFVSRSGELLLLIDELMYLQRMVEQVRADTDLLDPHMLLGSLVMTYAGEADRRGVSLNYDAPDHLPSFQGNAEAINRALVIMLEQAVESAAPRGRVDVGARPTADGVEFFVRDSGAAWDETDLRNMFTPRFDNGGLGFSAVKPIAEAHHGNLEISRENNLNIVRLRLPVKPGSLAE